MDAFFSSPPEDNPLVLPFGFLLVVASGDIEPSSASSFSLAIGRFCVLCMCSFAVLGADIACSFIILLSRQLEKKGVRELYVKKKPSHKGRNGLDGNLKGKRIFQRTSSLSTALWGAHFLQDSPG